MVNTVLKDVLNICTLFPLTCENLNLPDLGS